jgi:uncharacterized protein DUF4397
MSLSMNHSPVERAMTPVRFFSLGGVLLLAIGCSKEKSFTEPSVPQAGITWMNVVPDTGQVDMRVVDIPSSAGFFDANFRSVQPFPLGIEAGARRIKVFMSSPDPTISQMVLVDTQFTFTADAQYGFYVSGFSKAGLARATIVTGAAPAIPAGKFAIRVLNLAPSFAGAIPTMPDTTVHADGFLLKGNGLLPTGAPTIANAAFGAPSAYAVLDTGVYRLVLTPTGTTGPAIVQVTLPTGTPASAIADPIPGSQISGSALTMIITPRSVVGTTAPQGGRPTSKATDLVIRSNDTATVRSGTVTIVTRRRSPTDSTKLTTDTTLAPTGTGAATGVSAGNVVLVSGATQPEYNGWQTVMALADTTICRPSRPGDTATSCAAVSDTSTRNDTVTTAFRFRYRIAGTPVSPASGTTVYRLYTPTTADFTIPYITFVVDKRP